MNSVHINLVVEDALSEAVLRKILQSVSQDYAVGACYGRQGSGWIRKRIGGFNKAANGMPYLVLTDLDEAECPPALLKELLREPKHDNLVLRVAVREVEAWVLACRSAFAEFLGIAESFVPMNVDTVEDAKQCLIGLAKRSRKQDVRSDIVPRRDSTARVGPNYNGCLIGFVARRWEPGIAEESSESLKRTMEALERFRPKLEVK